MKFAFWPTIGLSVADNCPIVFKMIDKSPFFPSKETLKRSSSSCVLELSILFFGVREWLFSFYSIWLNDSIWVTDIVRISIILSYLNIVHKWNVLINGTVKYID